MKHLYTIVDEKMEQFGEETYYLREARKMASKISAAHPDQVFWIIDGREIEVDTYMNGKIY